jgi:hypothetical protein
VNLTDQQKDLLRLLVSKHESNGGAPFIFKHSPNTNRLSYSPRGSVRVGYDAVDFRRLRQERLITLIPVAENRLRGKPTEFGLAMVRCGFCPQRVMREFEVGCPLLAASVTDQLNQCGEQRESELNRKLDVAGAFLRHRRTALEQTSGKQEREAAEIALRRTIASLRHQILKLATALVRDGVREFANALVASQRRLRGRAVLIRAYTARFVAKIRDKLNESPVFQMEPLPAWRKDPMAQKAIQTCEEAITEIQRIESGLSSNAEESGAGPAGQNEKRSKTWPAIVQEWEAIKSTRRLWADDGERIPEADLRSFLARHYSTEPDNLTDGQIEYAALELCRHYGQILIIPLAVSCSPSAANESRNPIPIPDTSFWKEREDAFRQQDTGENRTLGATWFSHDGHWEFHVRSRTASLAEPVCVFKPLAVEAAKGLGSKRVPEPWMDWLDLLRLARDEETGELLYAKNHLGSRVIFEGELRRMIDRGEAIPAGGLIEFIGTEDGGVDRRTYWDTNPTIEDLFKSSANHCLRLQSQVPHFRPSAETTAEDIGVTEATNSDTEADFQADTWKDVEISFFNEHSMQITTGRIKATHDFGRLGMAHQRSGKPKRAWQMLHALAASKGILKHTTASEPAWKTVEKRMQELRTWLRERFGISADPLPYTKGVGYRAEFKISFAPSYRK